MRRFGTFTFRLNDVERQLLATLSARLHRSQSDTMRWLIREAMRRLEITEFSSRTIVDKVITDTKEE